jgi:hypothetical protein
MALCAEGTSLFVTSGVHKVAHFSQMNHSLPFIKENSTSFLCQMRGPGEGTVLGIHVGPPFPGQPPSGSLTYKFLFLGIKPSDFGNM